MSAIHEFSTLVKQKSHLSYPRWVRNVLDYVSRHLHQPISLSEIATYVQMQPGYLSVQFKKITGENLITYINIEKTKEAKYLLECTNLSLLEISVFLGYRSQGYFSKTFKQIQGISPLVYRQSKHQTIKKKHVDMLLF
ncbi:MAG: helix-turn-helix transcriptional regulator [Coprobacillaceae bacterium]